MPFCDAETGVQMMDAMRLPVACPEGWTAIGPAMCFEIKPKAGFLPTSAAIDKAHSVKRSISRLQLLQQLRLAKVQLLHSCCPFFSLSGLIGAYPSPRLRLPFPSPHFAFRDVHGCRACTMILVLAFQLRYRCCHAGTAIVDPAHHKCAAWSQSIASERGFR